MAQEYPLVAFQVRDDLVLHRASHLIAHRLAERAVVVGDLSQKQMVIPKKEDESPKERTKQHIRDRVVYNDWDLYNFVQMLTIRVSALWESTL